ncbi:hypothetical protein EDF70_11075 [Neorhizobium sp. JUb45]|nr:hypothetical protein EDF70_11075 [Neorhizobium sp. JUb45]
MSCPQALEKHIYFIIDSFSRLFNSFRIIRILIQRIVDKNGGGYRFTNLS